MEAWCESLALEDATSILKMDVKLILKRHAMLFSATYIKRTKTHTQKKTPKHILIPFKPIICLSIY